MDLCPPRAVMQVGNCGRFAVLAFVAQDVGVLDRGSRWWLPPGIGKTLTYIVELRENDVPPPWCATHGKHSWHQRQATVVMLLQSLGSNVCAFRSDVFFLQTPYPNSEVQKGKPLMLGVF